MLATDAEAHSDSDSDDQPLVLRRKQDVPVSQVSEGKDAQAQAEPATAGKPVTEDRQEERANAGAEAACQEADAARPPAAVPQPETSAAKGVEVPGGKPTNKADPEPGEKLAAKRSAKADVKPAANSPARADGKADGKAAAKAASKPAAKAPAKVATTKVKLEASAEAEATPPAKAAPQRPKLEESEAGSTGKVQEQNTGTEKAVKKGAKRDKDNDAEKLVRVKKEYEMPGQTRETPAENDSLRKFYTSLLQQNNRSEMAQRWCVLHGLLPRDQAEQWLSENKKLPQKSPAKPTSNGTLKRKSEPAAHGPAKKPKQGSGSGKKAAAAPVRKNKRKRAGDSGSEGDDADEEEEEEESEEEEEEETPKKKPTSKNVTAAKAKVASKAKPAPKGKKASTAADTAKIKAKDAKANLPKPKHARKDLAFFHGDMSDSNGDKPLAARASATVKAKAKPKAEAKPKGGAKAEAKAESELEDCVGAGGNSEANSDDDVPLGVRAMVAIADPVQ